MDEKLSRRKVLKIVALLGGAAAMPGYARDARAQGKANQCKVVEGDISPNGWCVAYSAKS